MLPTAYFNYRQHYGVAEEKAVQLSVVISFSLNYLGGVRKHKDMIIILAYIITHTHNKIIEYR